MSVRYGTHDGANCETVEVIVHKDEHAENHGADLRADSGLDVLTGPAAKSRGTARLVHKCDEDAEHDEERHNTHIVRVTQTCYDAAVREEHGVYRDLDIEVRVEQSAEYDADDK